MFWVKNELKISFERKKLLTLFFRSLQWSDSRISDDTLSFYFNKKKSIRVDDIHLFTINKKLPARHRA
jgi:hypothetical protein